MNRACTALYAAIKEAPERFDLRGVFADAVAADDPAWSEFLQLALRDDKFRRRTGLSEDRLIAPFIALGALNVGFQFGLPNALLLPFETFVERGDELLDLGPIVEVSLHASDLSWPAILPVLLDAPAVQRVRHLRLRDGRRFDLKMLLQIVRGRGLDKLIALTTPSDFTLKPTPETEASLEAELWDAIFSSPRRRSMIDWGLGLKPHSTPSPTSWREPRTLRSVGDRVIIDEEIGRLTTRFEPMPAENRELEQRYGYIPRLHAVNWDANVLDVMRGLAPAFPPGAPVSDAMYTVPPPIVEEAGGYRF